VINQTVVRFAPSPTGNLHIGGARTALFNYLFAKHNGGRFLLRIEDTDRERSRDEYTAQILDSLAWMGLTHDGDPVFQSDRTALYLNAVQDLLASGAAYRCFCSREDLLKQREAGDNWKYDGRCRHLKQQEIKDRLEEDRPFVVRLFIPEGRIAFEDRVRGHVEIAGSELEDLVLLRSDGSPTYQLTVVVDDHDMAVTDVIRGEDHLTNTFKQIVIYQAMQWPTPMFAHIPLILGPDRKRLSKRHGATAVDEYRSMGFLPEALVNFIALLGWNPGDDRELFALADLIQAFSLDRVSPSGGVFDIRKAEWFNSQYIAALPVNDLADRLADRFPELASAVSGNDPWKALVKLLQPRLRFLGDFPDQAEPFLEAPFRYDEKGVQKHFRHRESPEILEELIRLLQSVMPFNEIELEQALRQRAEEREWKAAALIHPLRLALTGRTSSPGIFETAVWLGRDECVRRVEQASRFVEGDSG